MPQNVTTGFSVTMAEGGLKAGSASYSASLVKQAAEHSAACRASRAAGRPPWSATRYRALANTVSDDAAAAAGSCGKQPLASG